MLENVPHYFLHDVLAYHLHDWQEESEVESKEIDLVTIICSNIDLYHEVEPTMTNIIALANRGLQTIESENTKIINFNYTNMETVQAIYNDLLVTTNEFHEVELQFQNLELAKQFAFGSLFCSKIFIAILAISLNSYKSCFCSSFNTGGRPKRFPAPRALTIPE